MTQRKQCVVGSAGRLRPDVVAQQGSLTIGGRRRTFITVSGRVRQPRPALVLMLHGTMQTARNIRPFAGYSFDTYAVGGRIVVIYPDAIHREWNSARKAMMLSKRAKHIDDVGFIRAVIDHAVAAEDVDPTKVFVAGFSLGGQMAIRLIHEIPELLAGVAVLSANLPSPDNFVVDRDAELALPILTIHGTADPLAPFNGGAVGFHGHLLKGIHLSAPETARYFAARNGITGAPTITQLPHQRDPGKPTSVARHDYARPGGCLSGSIPCTAGAMCSQIPHTHPRNGFGDRRPAIFVPPMRLPTSSAYL